MRSDLDEVRVIDSWLFGQLSKEETQLFEARLLVDEALAEKVEAQRTAHRLVRSYARREERGRLEQIYQQLFREAEFHRQLTTIFA